MIQAGTYNSLKAVRTAAEGIILSDGTEEVLLPEHQITKPVEIGDDLFVFVYQNKEGETIATTKRPHACAGDFAFLKVVAKTDNGAFLDLGIDKDIFIPLNQRQPLMAGKSYVVYVYLDKIDGKLTATTWLDDHIDRDPVGLEVGEEVSLLISEISDLGYSAIINNKHIGLLYRDEVYEDLEVGQTCSGYVKKIREDSNLIDLTLRQQGFGFILGSKDELLELLKRSGGVLPFGDKSSPEEIHEQLKMSKKAFKKISGMLYKERLIEISDFEIRLVNN
ncbi:MAG: RNA-binding protein [Sphingobacteriaceae bacterium]|jgi:predicted RNA-binding protein (virulence factor B family)|nr:RNA-binding protein [Sphingobacteriaceae bacterium]